ncbi:hypothetical protein DAI22_10g031300 [Oryza sativa Japonica Group]|nr:hypothetical protein DAI22_10g031300 [Oryza sativa Japonica Group]KAF2912695.1 hypothetical protein DAI22_10g031300 [Oryza sativa Japonica Group]
MRRSKKQRPRCCRRLLRRLELLVVGLWRSQGQAAEVFLLDLAAEELNLGPSMNNEATSIPKGDIVEELYSDTTSLWEKLRDNIAGSLEEMMSALDRMRQKCKRIMRGHSTGMHQKSTVPQDTGLRTPYRNNRLPLLGLPHRQDPQLPHVLDVGKACGTVYDKPIGQCR